MTRSSRGRMNWEVKGETFDLPAGESWLCAREDDGGLRRPVRRRRDPAAASLTTRVRQDDRLEQCHDRLALIFVPGREVELGPEILERLVLVKAAGDVRCAFDQDPAGRPYVQRVEVVAILQLRGVGEPELFVNGLLPHQRLVGLEVEREVMHRPRAEAPAAAGAIRLVQE